MVAARQPVAGRAAALGERGEQLEDLRRRPSRPAERRPPGFRRPSATGISRVPAGYSRARGAPGGGAARRSQCSHPRASWRAADPVDRRPTATLSSRWSDEMVVRTGDGTVLRSPIPAYLGNREDKIE
jgi:hypothetical protein